VIHGAAHVARGTVFELFWACNVATALLAVGCLAERPRLVAIAFSWLCFGTPMWLLDVATGGEVMVTSLFTHFGGLVLAWLAVRQLGMPRHTWWWATGGLVTVMWATRVLSPPLLNINLSHAVWAGWEPYFPRYDVYFAVVVGGFALTFFAVERSTRWMFERPTP
jgi:hypothetical protein